MVGQYQLYDAVVQSQRVTRHSCGRHDLRWTYGHLFYLARPWGAYMAGVPVPDPESGYSCGRCYLELCLSDVEVLGGEQRQVNRWIGMALWAEPDGVARALLEPDAWPWPIAAGEHDALLSRIEARLSPRAQEYWRAAAFLLDADEGLRGALQLPQPAAEAAQAPEEGIVCAECGEEHGAVPTAYVLRFPDLWFSVPRAEWAQRVWLEGPFCQIDAHRFLRGILRVPMLDHNAVVEIAAWLEVARRDFERAVERRGTPEWAAEPPIDGTLANAIAGYQPSTLHLECSLRPALPNEAPLISVAPADHPLAVEQRQGMSIARLRALAAG